MSSVGGAHRSRLSSRGVGVLVAVLVIQQWLLVGLRVMMNSVGRLWRGRSHGHVGSATTLGVVGAMGVAITHNTNAGARVLSVCVNDPPGVSNARNVSEESQQDTFGQKQELELDGVKRGPITQCQTKIKETAVKVTQMSGVVDNENKRKHTKHRAQNTTTHERALWRLEHAKDIFPLKQNEILLT